MPDLPDWMIEQLRGPQGEPGPAPEVVSVFRETPSPQADLDSYEVFRIPGTDDWVLQYDDSAGVGGGANTLIPPEGKRFVGGFVIHESATQLIVVMFGVAL